MPDYRLDAEAGKFKATGQNAKLIHTIVAEAVQKNWWLIAIYTVANLIAIYVSSCIIPVPWLNALVSGVVFVGSTYVGYLMICKVVTITREIH
ncbi:MAG: hypothetical protein JWQ49_3040 [Edaphobacter sp.]|nr:hypothetical protein [Edaphobacter sp.]